MAAFQALHTTRRDARHVGLVGQEQKVYDASRRVRRILTRLKQPVNPFSLASRPLFSYIPTMQGVEMSSFSISLPPSLRGMSGPRPKELHTSFVRPLTREDIILLLSTPQAAKARPIQEITNSHHRLARLLACGVRPVEVSRQTGYSMARISMLQRDPAFRELMAFYKNAVGEAFVNVIEIAEDLSVAALSELRQRIESEPETFSNMEIIKASAMLMDRTGHGPSRSVQITNTSDTIRALKERREAEGEDFLVLDPSEDEE